MKKLSGFIVLLGCMIIGSLGCPSKSNLPLTTNNSPSDTPTIGSTVTCLFPAPCGRQTVAGALFQAGSGNIVTCQISIPGYTGIQTIWAYLGNASGQVRAALYSDNGGGSTTGAPSGLVAQSNPQAAVNGWNTIPLPATYVNSGYYWLALQFQGSTAVDYAQGAGNTNYVSYSWGNFPTTYSSSGVAVADTLTTYMMVCNANTPIPSLTFTPSPTNTPSCPYIYTFAGTGTVGYTGDYGLASLAELDGPAGVAVDSSGNLYIADDENNVIRKVNSSTTITTWAGNGTAGYGGDLGAATEAKLYYPTGVAVDSSGNLYIADLGNNRIRKVDTTDTITTVAGDGTGGFSGDSGAATLAELNSPIGVAVDGGGNIYVGDTSNNRIRKVDTTGTITTVAGNGTAGFSGDSGAATLAELNSPTGLVVDSGGNIYFADGYNSRIRKVDTTGTITTVAGDGTSGFSGDNSSATSAEIYWPEGVVLDSSGNLYIADYKNNRIRKVNSGGTITTLAGNGTAGYSGDTSSANLAELNGPRGVAVDSSGNVYIADFYNDRVREVNCP